MNEEDKTLKLPKPPITPDAPQFAQTLFEFFEARRLADEQRASELSRFPKERRSRPDLDKRRAKH